MNYILHLEQRFDPEGWTKMPDDWPSSSLLINCQEVGLNSLWPRSLQLHGQLAGAGALGGILDATVKGANSGRVVLNRPPLGTWDNFDNRLNGRIWIYLNTDLVNVGWNLNPAEGRIGLQSEGWPVDFRNLEIEELKQVRFTPAPVPGTRSPPCSRRGDTPDDARPLRRPRSCCDLVSRVRGAHTEPSDLV